MVTEVCVISVREYLEDEALRQRLDGFRTGFSCPMNPDVERFFREQSVEFTRKSQSVTYVVTAADDWQMLGYFTLAIKPISVDIAQFSKTMQRKILRVAQQNESNGEYLLAAYLVAQLGKNFADVAETRIHGADLLSLALDKVARGQRLFGGMVAFLETEGNDKLLDFYGQRGFKRFRTKTLRHGESEHDLVQMLKIVDFW